MSERFFYCKRAIAGRKTNYNRLLWIQSKWRLYYFTITNALNSILDNLEYALAGKDKNSGKFSRMLYGNRLMGMYRFNSKGMTSTRLMVFIVNNNTLKEGFGEIKETGKGILFQDTSTINYTSILLLKRDSYR